MSIELKNKFAKATATEIATLSKMGESIKVFLNEEDLDDFLNELYKLSMTPGNVPPHIARPNFVAVTKMERSDIWRVTVPIVMVSQQIWNLARNGDTNEGMKDLRKSLVNCKIGDTRPTGDNDSRTAAQKLKMGEVTVGRFIAMFPEFATYVSHTLKHDGKISIRGKEYKYNGPWPMAYRHMAGLSVIPHDELDASSLTKLVTGFMHWQNWYVSTRRAAGIANGGNRRNKDRKPATLEKVQNQRSKTQSILMNQFKSTWPKEDKVLLGDKVKYKTAMTTQLLQTITDSNYDPIKDEPPAFDMDDAGLGFSLFDDDTKKKD
jgi:hypothetical protein